MKKIIYLSVIVFVSMACKPKIKTVEEYYEEPPKNSMQLFIEDCVKQVPNALDNAFTREMASDTICSRVEAKTGETLDILDGAEFSYDDSQQDYINKTFNTGENSKGYVVKMKLLPKYRLFDNPTRWIRLEVLAVVDKDDVFKLNNNSRYTLNGKLYKVVEKPKIGDNNVGVLSLGELFIYDAKIKVVQDEEDKTSI